jgi:phenylacetate-CoA ligase
MSYFRRTLARHGYALAKRRRYCHLKALTKTQWLSNEELSSLQKKKLQSLLEYAYRHVPYYRDLFDKIRFHPSELTGDPASFLKIPTLSKDLVRKNFERLKTTEKGLRRTLMLIKTGGSSGEPLAFLEDANCRNHLVSHFFRYLQWAGWRLGDPRAYIWGRLLAGADARNPIAARVRYWLTNRFSLNAYLLNRESMTGFAARLSQAPGAVLIGYASCLFRFAQFLRESMAQAVNVKAVFSTSEVLYPAQRELIEAVFGCKVFNLYSTEEFGAFACECEFHAGMHLSPESVYLEVLRDGRPVRDGEEGEFVITNLNSHGFPLIRYEIQDWGRKMTRQCACGRGLPLIEIVHGRVADLFKTRDGKIAWGGFAGRMFAVEGVRQYQVIQKTDDLLVARIVADGPIDPKKLEDIQKAARIALGDNVIVKFEFVDNIPRQSSGKHRYFVSEAR